MFLNFVIQNLSVSINIVFVLNICLNYLFIFFCIIYYLKILRQQSYIYTRPQFIFHNKLAYVRNNPLKKVLFLLCSKHRAIIPLHARFTHTRLPLPPPPSSALPPSRKGETEVRFLSVVCLSLRSRLISSGGRENVAWRSGDRRVFDACTCMYIIYTAARKGAKMNG